MHALSLAELKFQASIVIVKRHTDPELTADAIAKQLSVSRRHLDRAFEDGRSVSQQIMAYRVVTAAMLLMTDAVRDIDELATRSGFKNRNTFREQFVRFFGVQPSRARQLARDRFISLPTSLRPAI